jgi:hypothetical protein
VWHLEEAKRFRASLGGIDRWSVFRQPVQEPTTSKWGVATLMVGFSKRPVEKLAVPDEDAIFDRFHISNLRWHTAPAYSRRLIERVASFSAFNPIVIEETPEVWNQLRLLTNVARGRL